MTSMESESSLTAVLERHQRAINHHDLDALAACFEPDYHSEFPVHPDRTFRGHEQMRKNWTQIFGTVPDIEAVLLRCTSVRDTAWAEWEWRDTRADGTPFAMRGVTIQAVRQDRIVWARLYMEPVQEGGAGADEGVRQSLAGR
jgi:ketosteroid isomerase-like protein